MASKLPAVLEKQNAELRKENKALKDTVTTLLKEIDRIREIERAPVVRIELTPEQRILETQIMRLEAVSMERSLTLEETRALDLHIKNKRLLEDKSTINADYTNIPEGMSDADLLRIASNVEEEVPAKKTKRRGKSKASN